LKPCPTCGETLHVDTGSILDFEEGLVEDPVFFCTWCGYDSSPFPPLQPAAGVWKQINGDQEGSRKPS